MATQAFTSLPDIGQQNIVTWAAGTDGDTGTPYKINGARALAGAVQITAGTPGTVTMQVSLDGTNWATLVDVAGNNVALAALTTVAEFSTAALFIRPSYGTSAAGAVVTMVLRG